MTENRLRHLSKMSDSQPIIDSIENHFTVD